MGAFSDFIGAAFENKGLIFFLIFVFLSSVFGVIIAAAIFG